MSKKERYQIISRKFRPQTFASVIGQEVIVTTLKNALRKERLAQAYLFCGSRGTGKTSLARLFAKALNCEHLTEDFEPCNTCSSCIDIAKARSLNVLEIDGASNRGIDDIRQINETAGYATLTGKYKIYIIDEVHMLTKEAFNALLKTLEEPPPNVKFFFATTEAHKILPTIISRCQRFDLKRLSTEEIKTKLKGIALELEAQIEDAALALIAQKSEGSLRDAESLLDQVICFGEEKITLDLISSHLGVLSKDYFFRLDEAIFLNDLSFGFTLVKELFDSGKDVSSFIETLMEHFRTLLCLKFPKSSTTPTFLSEEERKKYQQSALKYEKDQLLYILDYLVSWASKLQKSSERLYLEMILLHILRSKHRITVDQLCKRLLTLETGKEPEDEKPIPSPIIFEEPIKETAPVREEKVKEGPSLEEKLLSAIKAKIANPPPLPKEAPPEMPVEKKIEAPVIKKIQTTQPKLTIEEQSKYDSIIRFAAIELEGTIKE